MDQTSTRVGSSSGLAVVHIGFRFNDMHEAVGRIEELGGELVAGEGAPKAVTESLKELRKAKRWVGMESQAGPEGIAVERTPGRRQNMWLYDLWLAERLLEVLEED